MHARQEENLEMKQNAHLKRLCGHFDPRRTHVCFRLRLSLKMQQDEKTCVFTPDDHSNNDKGQRCILSCTTQCLIIRYIDLDSI
jgi:hypothetical protein